MARYRYHRFQADYVELFRDGIHYSNMSYIAPSNRHGLNYGFGWARLSLSDDYFNYSEDDFSLGIAKNFRSKLKIGFQLRAIRVGFDPAMTSDISGFGLSLNAGILFKPFRNLWLGAKLSDIGDAYMRVDDETSYKLFGFRQAVGFNYLVGPARFLFSLTQDSAHTGLEFRYHPWLWIRAGFEEDFDLQNEYKLSGGIGVSYNRICLDYAYQHHSLLADNHYLSISLLLPRRTPPIVIENIQIGDIFPVLYKNYSVHPIGYVQVKNISQESCRIGAILSLPPYTVESVNPYEWYDIESNKTRSIPLYFFGSDNILNVLEDQPVSVSIHTYSLCQEERVTTTNGETLLHQRNAITWEDPKKIGAFIYPGSEIVDKFVRETLRNYEQDVPTFLPIPFVYAVQIFDELGELQVRYKSDPNHPFGTILRDNQIDTVQDPSETLSKRTGDCDDLVVLYASCLENIGLSIAIVDFPGHLFMMFKIHNQDISDYIETLYGVEWEEEVWYPVEATAIGGAWVEANLIGKQQYEAWRNRSELQIFTLSEAWEKYPPVRFPNSINVLTVNPLTEILERDYQIMKEQLIAVIQQRNKTEEYPDPISALGMTFAGVGLYQQAAATFRKEIIKNPKSVNYHNNLGNVYALAEDFEQALHYYNRALELAPDDPDLMLNISLMLHQLNRWNKALSIYNKAKELNPDMPVHPALENLKRLRKKKFED